MLLLNAFCLSYLKAIVNVNAFDPFVALVFGSWLWSNNLRREMPDEVSNHSSTDEVPPPDPWRDEEPVPPIENKTQRVLWPHSLSLHLLSSSWSAVVSLHMLFYILHLKLNGHRFESWSICCTKLLSLRLTWNDLKWPF